MSTSIYIPTHLEAYQPHITRVAAQFPTTPMITILEAFSEALDYLNNLSHTTPKE